MWGGGTVSSQETMFGKMWFTSLLISLLISLWVNCESMVTWQLIFYVGTCLVAIFISIFKILPTVYYDISTAKNLLLLANSTEEQQKWVSRLVKKIPKKPPAPDPFARSSPRTSMKVQPNQSIRRPSRQLPPNKPRWQQEILFSLLF